MSNLENKLKKIVEDFNKSESKKSFNEIELLISKNKNEIELYKIYGQMLYKKGRLDEALKNFLYFNTQKKNDALILNYIYSILIKRKLFDEALKYINILLNLNSEHFEANRDKSFILLEKKDFINARKYNDFAINLKPTDCYCLNISGLIYLKENKIIKAKSCFEKAIEINKNYLDSYNNLGTCYFDLENLSEAFRFFKKAYRLDNLHINSIINIANILSLKDKNKSAINFYKKVLSIFPNHSETISNIAICYCRANDEVNAKIYYEKAINLNPNDEELKYAYSTFNIKLNNFKIGWPLFESRFKIRKNLNKLKSFKQKENSLFNINIFGTNESILVLREQGIGEEILFSSIYNDLISSHSNLKIETDKRLINVFKRSFKKDIFVPEGYYSNNLSKYDFKHVLYSGSLIKYFRTRVEDFKRSKYLVAEKNIVDKFKIRLGHNTKNLKVGISWRSIINIYGSLKSMTIKDFEPFFEANRQIINLQYGNIDDEVKYLKNQNKKIEFFEDVNLFNEIDSCLGLLSNLDLFVTVSNSTAHLAGALGIPTILICPKKSSTYYYWNTYSENSVWYKNIRVIGVKDSLAKTIKRVNNLIKDKYE
ncbi:tetratricopeptide repeat protein [Pelagibacteraceae bacterium]|nr:tetratricopeptide repeat protein [Pelagibacteraceae bacterium]